MKNYLALISFLIFTLVNFSVFSQSYTMSNTTVNTCSGTFYDPGGSGGNYGNNQLNTMTFCSSTPGSELQFVFTLWNLETCCDVLTIYDGPNTGSPILFSDDGSTSPGTIVSSSGCLTFVWDSDGSVVYSGWAATISCYTPTCTDGIMNGLETGVDCGGPTCLPCPDCNNGIQDGNETDIDCGGACAPCPTPCDVSISSVILTPPLDCNGGDVQLTATGVGAFEYVLYNNFDNGTAGNGWNSTGGASFGTPCGQNPTGTPYYWASTSVGTPQLTTIPFDVSCGGVINFDMNYATQGGASPCEGPDLPNEGVTFQYSTNGGATWTTIQYWDPNGGYDPMLTSWNTYSFPIPAAAMTPNTIFQWIQNNSSGTCCDNWGIDNVSITSILNCTPYYYDWAQVPGAPDNAVQNETVTTTTTYVVTYTNGTDACSDSITIVVPPGTTADAGPDQVVCASSPNVVIGANPVCNDDGATFTWSNGAGSGTIDLNPVGGTTTGQQTVSPAVTTNYTVSVTFNGCTTTDDMTVTIDAPPTASNPATINVQCSGDVPLPNPAVVTDEADAVTATPTVTFLSDVSDGLSCPETITRTYRVTDGCGNFVDVQQLIIIEDTQAPVFAAAPANITVQCAGNVPAATNLGWTDNCDGAGSVLSTDGPLTGGPCGGTITRTWTYSDACGNAAIATQVITVDDTTLPTASSPTPISAPGGTVPPPDITVVTDEADNCGTPTVAWVSDVSDNGICPEIITRTYSVTDGCGNQITVDQMITVGDAIVPTASNPAPITVQCSGDVPLPDPLVVTDEADNGAAPTVTFESESSNGLSCPETITRSYRVTDDCGNFILVTQIITVNDTQAPVFAAAPASINVQCSADVPAMTSLGWTDNCDGSGTVLGNDVSDGLSCPETITRTWTYTDACGNPATTSQTITVNDTQAPVFAAPPVNVTVECVGDVPGMTNLGWTDNCDGAGSVAGSDGALIGGTCGGTITRTWTYTDACGNVVTTTQTITVDDSTPPTASNPAPISVPGANDVPAPDPTVVTDEADNCTVNPAVVWVSDVSDGNVCNGEVITRTYSVTDDCGNQITVTQLITIDAVPAPIDAGPDQTICEGTLTTLTADNPWNVPISWSPAVPGGPFDPIQTTTYTVTADNYGCISQDDVTITVEAAPVVSFMGDVLSGCAPLTVTFTNTSTAASGLVDCEWTMNGQTLSGCGTVTYTFPNGGLYDVTLTTTSATGCVASATYTDYIDVEEIPVASFIPSQTTLSTLFSQVLFDNTSTGATTYQWDFGDNSAVSTVENPSHEFPMNEQGTYTVELTAFSPLGCFDVAYANITIEEQLIYYVPNSFTPDGDDYNEYFKAQFTEGYDPFDFTMFIFNRWGEVIWESHDASVGWDGTYGMTGNEVQDGTYTWKIEFKTTQNDERKMITGNVNVIR